MEQKYIQQIAGKLSLTTKRVTNIFQMNSEGATIPFMALYRKEATGNLDEVVIGNVVEGLLTSTIFINVKKQSSKQLKI